MDRQLSMLISCTFPVIKDSDDGATLESRGNIVILKSLAAQ